MRAPSGSSTSLKGRLRRWARLAHLWLRLTAGLIFAVAGVTGAVLVFYVEGDRAAQAELRRLDVGRPRLRLRLRPVCACARTPPRPRAIV